MKKILSLCAIALMSCAAPVAAESSLYGGSNTFQSYGSGITYSNSSYVASSLGSMKGVVVIWYRGNPYNSVPFNYGTTSGANTSYGTMNYNGGGNH